MKVKSRLYNLLARRGSRQISPQRAIVSKEFRSIFRDISQSTQIMFVSGVCILYIMNVRMFITVDSFPKENQLHWRTIFFVLHASITAFFTSSICTRIVFSSVSLEGKQFWLLQTAPLDLHDLLSAKLTAWYRPVALASALLLGIGVFVIEPRWEIVTLFVAMSLFISYGIVAMGIGLGAHFADFSWEHPSQLILSLGSVMYMLSSAALILLNIFPLALLLRATMLTTSSQPFSIGLAAAVSIVTVNFLVGRYALRLGERSLKQNAGF